MTSMRKFARVIAILWIVGVVAIGLAGTYASRNQDEIAEGALDLAGINVAEIETERQAKLAQSEAKRKAAQFEDDDWGDTVVPGQDNPSDWGN